MKTFKDLEFKPHQFGNGKHAIQIFENGYGVSVVRFRLNNFGESSLYGSYTSNETEWELAVIKGTENNWQINYDTDITDDVIGHLSAKEVTEVMKRIQLLKE